MDFAEEYDNKNTLQKKHLHNYEVMRARAQLTTQDGPSEHKTIE